ncbi:hypothetical protein GQ53DRAFT_94317 [Thozetella sp. PMI_491]|nr:hypothetical protein GQ53DRAFT_94317 [Thozetella sp. PMI_491]
MRRELTYPQKDKLVTLFAIATRMASRLDDFYIAGHFWKSLPESLLWSNPRRGEVKRRFAPTVGGGSRQTSIPSWSWAAVGGPVLQHDCGHLVSIQSVVDMEAYELVLVNEANPVGQCVHASLTLMAHYREVQWKRAKPAILPRSGESHVDIGNLTVYLDDPTTTPLDGTRHLIITLATERLESTAWELLLLASAQGVEEIYERCGLFHVYIDIVPLFSEGKRRIVLV